MRRFKQFVRAIFPEEVISWWHWSQTMTAAVWYRFPTKKMIVIGITGSKGKTTTSNMIWAALSASGAKVGQTGTANIRIGADETLNPYHMTMPGRWYLQKILRQMADAKCRYVVIETPSEGQKHYRQAGINYDMLVFTNLTEEHLIIHHRGSIEQLKIDNARVFRRLDRQKRKVFDSARIAKTIIVNNDSPDSTYYQNHAADKHASFAVEHKADYQATNINTTVSGTTFTINQATYEIPIIGRHNVINAAAAVAVARELGMPSAVIKRGLSALTMIPGRMEQINAGQNFSVFVDYAHEPVGLELLLKSTREIIDKKANIIIHLGAEGGGRDKQKRPLMGEIAAKLADTVVIGNVDPYSDNPTEIIDDIRAGAMASGKVLNKNLFCIEDRRTGIAKALSLAKAHDVVLITGKGAEQSYIESGRTIPWDDRLVVREELKNLR